MKIKLDFNSRLCLYYNVMKNKTYKLTNKKENNK